MSDYSSGSFCRITLCTDGYRAECNPRSVTPIINPTGTYVNTLYSCANLVRMVA
jgi:hypothetical protein